MTKFLIPSRLSLSHWSPSLSKPEPEEYIFGNRTPAHVVSLRACEPKHLFDPITWNEILVTILCFLGGSLAAASGLGGGAIYVPLLLLLPHYETHRAIPISTVMIFGSALSNVFLLLLQTHPTATSAGTVTVNRKRDDKSKETGSVTVTTVVSETRSSVAGSDDEVDPFYQGQVLPDPDVPDADADVDAETEQLQLVQQRKKPLIDFDTALVLEPIVLAGTEVGVVLNMLFPGYLMTIVLIVVLVLASARTCWKGVRMCRIDCKKNKEETDIGINPDTATESETETTDGSRPTEGGGGQIEPPVTTTSDEGNGSSDQESMAHSLTTTTASINVARGTMIDVIEDESEPLLRLHPNIPTYGGGDDDESEEEGEDREMEKTVRTPPDWILWLQWCDGCRVQFVQVGILMVFWGIVCLSSLLRGSKRMESIAGVKLCSWEYFLILVFSWLVLVGCTVVIGVVLMSLFRLKVRHGVKFAEEEVKWTPKNALLIPLFFLIAGIVAGLLGLGGGIVVSPLLLELGMNPQSSMATSAFMVLITSSCTTMQFAVLGQLTYDYSLWFAGFGLLSAIVGQTTIFFFVKKFGKGKVYIIVFVIAITLFVCCMLMGGVGIKDIIANILAKDWNAFKFQKFC